MGLIRISLMSLFVGLLWTTSCARQQHEKRSEEMVIESMVTESRALELAKAEFAKTGRKVSDYDVTIEMDSTGSKWLAWFDKKGPYAMPGGKHVVTVEKATGKVVFMPGE